MLGLRPRLNFALVEPESDLLLRGLNTVRAVADIATDILMGIHGSAIYQVDWSIQMLTMAKSPRIVPGAEASGFVAPRS